MLDLTDWQNKKYTTRGGHQVRILCVDAKGDAPIIGLITIGELEYTSRWGNSGICVNSVSSDDNLINAKTKREGWVNIAKLDHFISEFEYYFRSGYVTDRVFSSKEEADKHHFNIGWGVDRIACVRIEWEE